MQDDVESTLESLERRLRALQAELDEDPAPADAPPDDALARFDEALQRATRELTTAWDRALAAARGSTEELIVRGELALDARADLDGLCALHRALRAIPEVDGVVLRAYAGGHAALDVALGRPVALADALGDLLPVTVVEARPGRLGIALG